MNWKATQEAIKRATEITSPFYAVPVAIDKLIRVAFHGRFGIAKELPWRDHVVFGIVAATVFLMWFFKEAAPTWRARRFFALPFGREALLILPTFQTGERHIGYKTNLARQKEKRNLGGWTAYPYELADEIQRLAMGRAEFLDGGVAVQIDEQILSPDRRLIIHKQVADRTVFAFGSSSSNLISAYVLQAKQFHSASIYHFAKRRPFKTDPPDSGYVLYSEELDAAYAALGHEIADDAGSDYLVLLRHTMGKTTYFVCAGLAQAGTLAGVHLLFEEWEDLYRETKDRDFYAPYKLPLHSGGRGLERLLLAIRANPKTGYTFVRP